MVSTSDDSETDYNMHSTVVRVLTPYPRPLPCFHARCRFFGNISADSLLAFQDQYFKGELKPTLKSEEPSEEDTMEPVKVLKGKSFSSMVLENGDDLFSSFCWLL